MAILNQKRILNLIPKVSAPVTIHVSQGDVGTEIEFTLVKGDEVFSDTGNLTASVHGVREDGANFGPFTCTLSGSKVTFPLHSEMTAVKGSALAEIVLVNNGGNKVGSANFGILVEESVFPLGVTYDNDVSVYEAILTYVQGAVASMNTDLTDEILARMNADSALNTRIDNIIAPSGGAPSAAEVTDARIGADGVTYNTLGEAIRTNDNNLKSALGVLQDASSIGVTDVEYTMNGGIINNNNQVGLDDGYFKHLIVSPVSGGDIFAVTTDYLSDSNYSEVLFYSGDTIINKKKYSADLRNEIVSAPSGATKMVVNMYISHLYDIEKISIQSVDNINEIAKSPFKWVTVDIATETGMMRKNIAIGAAEAYDFTSDANFRHIKCPISYGEHVKVQGSIFEAAVYNGLFYLNKDSKVVGKEEVSSSGHRYQKELGIPFNAKYVVINIDAAYMTGFVEKGVEQSIETYVDVITQNKANCRVKWTDAHGTQTSGVFSKTANYIGKVITYSFTTISTFKHIEYPITQDDNGRIRIVGASFTGEEFNYYAYLDYEKRIISFTSVDTESMKEISAILDNIPINARYVVVNGDLSIARLCIEEAENTVGSDDYWVGKKIVWFGTSIPAGVVSAGSGNETDAYPNLVGELLGATVYNEAVGSSAVRFGNHAYVTAEDPHGLAGQWKDNFLYSLSGSVAEKQAIFDNWSTWKNIIGGGGLSDLTDAEKKLALRCSWDRKLVKYLSGGYVGPVDLYVFDHGHNEEFGGNYDEIKTAPPSNDKSNRSYFRGAMRFIIEKILSDNPRARIVFIGHYENQLKKGVSEAQVALESDWGFPLCKTWERLGWSQNTITVNGTETTILNIWCPDGLHPATDTTGKALHLYAETLYSFIRDVR